MEKSTGECCDRYCILHMKCNLSDNTELWKEFQRHEHECQHVPPRLILDLMSHNARIWAMESLLKDMKNLEDCGIIALKIRDENKLRTEKIEDINKWQFIRNAAASAELRNSRSPESSAAQAVANTWTSPT